MIKIKSVKQKSKLIFSVLQQRKPSFSLRPNYNQSFLSYPLPGHQQEGSTSDIGRGFYFSKQQWAEVTTYQIFVSSEESGNYQSRDILTHASCNRRFISS